MLRLRHSSMQYHYMVPSFQSSLQTQRPPPQMWWQETLPCSKLADYRWQRKETPYQECSLGWIIPIRHIMVVLTHTRCFQPPSLQSPGSRSDVNKREQSQNRGLGISQDTAGYCRHGFLNPVTMGKRKEEKFSELLIVFLSFKARIHINGGFYVCCVYADYKKTDIIEGELWQEIATQWDERTAASGAWRARTPLSIKCLGWPELGLEGFEF